MTDVQALVIIQEKADTAVINIWSPLLVNKRIRRNLQGKRKLTKQRKKFEEKSDNVERL